MEDNSSKIIKNQGVIKRGGKKVKPLIQPISERKTEFTVDKIKKNITLAGQLDKSDYDDCKLPTIEEYTTEQLRKQEEARLEQQRRIEESRRIEEAVDLTYVEPEAVFVERENRVSYKRTFGVPTYKKRAFDKITTTILLVVAGILMVVSFLLRNSV